MIAPGRRNCSPGHTPAEPRGASHAGPEFLQGIVSARRAETRSSQRVAPVCRSAFAEDDLLSAVVQHPAPKLGEQLAALLDGGKVVAGQLPRLAGETG